jgi:glycosyltransferase involved in cell wall biosynthesis
MATLKLRRETEPFDVLHAWGGQALFAAVASGVRRPVVFTPTRFPTQHDIRWLRAVAQVSRIQIVCPTDTMRRRLVERGVPNQCCHLIRPGVEFARINRRADPRLRAALGLGADDYVLLGAGESLRGANHHTTILAAAVLHVFDPRYKLLMWGRGPQAPAERAFGARMLPANFISWATDHLGHDAAFEQLLAAADAVLVTADAPVPVLPIAVCMAAALPIVAVVTPTISELLEDRHTALMVGRASSRALARRVLDLQEDPRLVWSICDMARTEAYEYFAMTRFVDQHRTLYQQVARGQTVSIPQPAPGAGLRFHARA